MSNLIIQGKYIKTDVQKSVVRLCSIVMHYNSKKKKNKKIIKKKYPTEPIIFSFVTGNKHIFFIWPWVKGPNRATSIFDQAIF